MSLKNLASKYLHISEIENWIKENLSMGSIDVNIMTKLDKENYNKDKKLSAEFNDAHAVLRGYANSDKETSTNVNYNNTSFTSFNFIY